MLAAVTEPDSSNGLKREAEAPPEEDSRSFKLRKKSLNPGLGEIYDPGLIPIKVKKKEVQGDSQSQEVVQGCDIKTEDDQPPVQPPDTSNALTESLFKKRKAPATGSARGRRQI